MARFRFFYLVLLFVAFSFVACDKENDYPTDSIVGPWQLVEQWPPAQVPYVITIETEGAVGSDNYTIYNFDNQGSVNPFGVKVVMMDTVLNFVDGMYSGEGAVKRDYSAIYWTYAGRDGIISAKFKRP